MRDPIIGIDLGTSNTVVAHVDATGKPVVLADDNGHKIHPSVVSFHPNGGVVIGAAAKQRKVIDPQNTIYSVKRLIGRSFHSPEVQTAIGRSPFRIVEGENQAPMIVTRAGQFAVPEISAILLDYARNIAAERLSSISANRAVVTVPASFNDAQRSATATAGSIANLDVVRVINEPTAAALAYGNTRNLRETIAVYDFGGGTFDVTVLKLADQVYEVLGTAGDTFLGGDDLDERIVDRMVAKFLTENRVDLRANEIAMMRLRAVAEQTKIELSRRARAVVRIDEIAYGPRGKPLDLQIEITRDEFVRQVSDIIDRTFPVCQEALALAGLGADQIDDVILVGGTTKIPYVRDQVARFFGKAPRTDVNPEDAVAVGASLQAHALQQARGRAASAVAAFDLEAPTTESTVTETEHAPTQAPSELATGAPRVKRPTAEYQTPKPDTSYTVTRGGVRDVYGKQQPPPPPPAATPLARMARAASPPNEVAKTLAGVRAATPPPVPNRPATTKVPVVPRPPAPVEARPPAPRTSETAPSMFADSITAADPIPAGDSFSDADQLGRALTFGDTETQEKTLPPVPAPTPQRPVPPAPPNARTLVAQLPVDLPTVVAEQPIDPGEPFRRLASDFDDEQPPSSTARGFEPAAAFPAPGAVPIVAAPAPVVLDVTPRGLGIATVAGFCEELIRRNSRLPAAIKKLFTTSRDAQDLVRIVVCQGESRRLDNNTVIGDLVLANLPPRPRGETSIEVTFSLDASGILQVRARDAATGREQSAALDLVGGMAQQDVAVSRDRIAALRR